MIWSDLHKLISNNTSFLLSAHTSPDGDSIGCQLAVRWYLLSLGKKVHIYDVDGLPNRFAFLQDSASVTAEKPTETFDVLAVIDSSNLDRLGWDDPASSAKCILNIDHHRDNKQFGLINVVQPSAATGEVLYRFFDENKIDFPKHVAEYLYAAMLTDTGGFRFSNTNGGILHMCGDLADRGVSCAAMYEKLYATYTPQGMMLMSRIWSSLRYYLDGKVCVTEMPMTLVEELGATYGDSEGAADLTTMVSGIQVGLMIKHSRDLTHFSLRSRDIVDVGELAKIIPGGGGHSNAAGCTIHEPIETALPKMLDMIKNVLA